MILDFRNCKTVDDVNKVFEDNKEQIALLKQQEVK